MVSASKLVLAHAIFFLYSKQYYRREYRILGLQVYTMYILARPESVVAHARPRTGTLGVGRGASETGGKGRGERNGRVC